MEPQRRILPGKPSWILEAALSLRAIILRMTKRYTQLDSQAAALTSCMRQRPSLSPNLQIFERTVLRCAFCSVDLQAVAWRFFEFLLRFKAMACRREKSNFPCLWRSAQGRCFTRYVFPCIGNLQRGMWVPGS